jgi:hypothetical protein
MKRAATCLRMAASLSRTPMRLPRGGYLVQLASDASALGRGLLCSERREHAGHEVAVSGREVHAVRDKANMRHPGGSDHFKKVF